MSCRLGWSVAIPRRLSARPITFVSSITRHEQALYNLINCPLFGPYATIYIYIICKKKKAM